MAMPYSVKLEIDDFRKEKPSYSNLSDEAIYRHLKSRKPHLKWDDADKAPAKSRKKRDSSPS